MPKNPLESPIDDPIFKDFDIRLKRIVEVHLQDLAREITRIKKEDPEAAKEALITLEEMLKQEATENHEQINKYLPEEKKTYGISSNGVYLTPGEQGNPDDPDDKGPDDDNSYGDGARRS